MQGQSRIASGSIEDRPWIDYALTLLSLVDAVVRRRWRRGWTARFFGHGMKQNPANLEILEASKVRQKASSQVVKRQHATERRAKDSKQIRVEVHT